MVKNLDIIRRNYNNFEKKNWKLLYVNNLIWVKYIEIGKKLIDNLFKINFGLANNMHLFTEPIVFFASILSSENTC